MVLEVSSTDVGAEPTPHPFIDRPHAELWVRAAVDKFEAEWDYKHGRPGSIAV